MTLQSQMKQRVLSGFAFGLGKTRVAEQCAGAIVVTPSGSGSLGDEAMIGTTVGILERARVAPLGMVVWEVGHQCPGVSEAVEQIQLPSRSLCSWFSSLWRVRTYRQAYVLGADMLDGYYSEKTSVHLLRLAYLMSMMGVNVTIVGCSMRAEVPVAIERMLKALPSHVRLCARDPVSYDRLKRLAARPVVQTADVAFLLEPDTQATTVQKVGVWADAERLAGRCVVAVNVNQQVLPIGSSLIGQDLVHSHVAAITTLTAQPDPAMSFLLVPHDYRSEERGDHRLAAKIYEALPPAARAHCYLMADRLTAGQVKGLVRHCDAALSGRMHLAIACLGQQVPVGTVVYQGKFEGLYQHFGIEGMTVTSETAVNAGKLTAFLRMIVDQRESLRHRIGLHLPQVRLMSERNLLCPVERDRSDVAGPLQPELPGAVA